MEGARSITFSKASECAGENKFEAICCEISRRYPVLFLTRCILCLSSQTILEMGELYNLHRCKLYDSQGVWGSYNLHDPLAETGWVCDCVR